MFHAAFLVPFSIASGLGRLAQSPVVVDSGISPAGVLREMLGVFATGDLTVVEDLVADDYVDHQGLAGSPLLGPEGFSMVVRGARRAFADLQVVVEHENERACQAAALVAWTYTAENRSRVERRTLEIICVEGAKTKEHWGRGVIPPETTAPHAPPFAACPKVRTYLQMTSIAELRPSRHSPRLSLQETEEDTLLRRLHDRIGQAHGWPNRAWTTDELQHDDSAGPRLWLARLAGEPVGYVEITMPPTGDFEIVTFGLVPEALGQRLGGEFLTAAVRLAWAHGARRLWLHTNNWDHPNALANYLARGFAIFKIELR